MKKNYFISIIFLIPILAFSQENQWNQKANFTGTARFGK